MILRRSTKYDGRCTRCLAALAALLPQDCDTVTSNLNTLTNVDETSLLRRRCAQAGKWGRIDYATQATELKFGKDFENENMMAVEVVERQVTDGCSSDDNFDA